MATRSTYREQMSDPRWCRRREQIIQRDDGKCRECARTDSLNAHHRYYYVGRDAWDYPDEALVTLCEPCHNNYHGNIDAIKRVVGELSSFSLERLVVFVKQLIRDDGNARSGEDLPIQFDAETLIDIMAEIRTSPRHAKR